MPRTYPSLRKNEFQAANIVSFFADLREWSTMVFINSIHFHAGFAYAFSQRKAAATKAKFEQGLLKSLGKDYETKTNIHIKNRFLALLWDLNQALDKDAFTPNLVAEINSFLQNKYASSNKLSAELLITTQKTASERGEWLKAIYAVVESHHQSIRNILSGLRAQIDKAVTDAKKSFQISTDLNTEEQHSATHPKPNNDISEPTSSPKARPRPKHKRTVGFSIPAEPTSVTTLKTTPKKIDTRSNASPSPTPPSSGNISEEPEMLDVDLSENDAALGQRQQSEPSELEKIFQRRTHKLSHSLFDDLSEASDEEDKPEMPDADISIHGASTTLTNDSSAYTPSSFEPVSTSFSSAQPSARLVNEEKHFNRDTLAHKLHALGIALNDIHFWNQKTSYKFLCGGVKTKIGETELRVPRHIAEFRRLILTIDTVAAAREIAQKAMTQVNNKASGYRLWGWSHVRQEPMDSLLKTVSEMLHDHSCSVDAFKASLAKARGKTAWQPLAPPAFPDQELQSPAFNV